MKKVFILFFILSLFMISAMFAAPPGEITAVLEFSEMEFSAAPALVLLPCVAAIESVEKDIQAEILVNIAMAPIEAIKIDDFGTINRYSFSDEGFPSIKGGLPDCIVLYQVC
jgi:hypothetical protein